MYINLNSIAQKLLNCNIMISSVTELTIVHDNPHTNTKAARWILAFNINTISYLIPNEVLIVVLI